MVDTKLGLCDNNCCNKRLCKDQTILEIKGRYFCSYLCIETWAETNAALIKAADPFQDRRR